MIVRKVGESEYQLIRQIDHAVMSAQIARKWRPPEGLSDVAWQLLIEAVEHHDDGWEQADRTVILGPGGQPLDFNHIPTDRHLEIWQKSVQLGAERHPYVDLLISLHARWLYTKFSRQEEPEAVQAWVFDWMEELTGHVDRALERCASEGADIAAAVEPKMLSQAQRLVSIFDGLSLMLLGAIVIQESTAPLAFGKQTAALRLILLKKKLACWPWPFISARVKAEVPYCSVTDEQLSDPNAVWEALAGPSETKLQWTLQPE